MTSETEKTKAHRVVVLKLAERDSAALVGDGGARVAIDDRLDVGARGKGDRAGVAAEHLADLEIRAVELRIVALERRQRDSAALVRNGLARVSRNNLFGVGAVCSGKQQTPARDAGRKEKGGERGRQEGCRALDHGSPAEALKTTAENWKGGEAMGETEPWRRTARVSWP